MIDFGIARAYDVASEVTRTGQVVGTPTYLAPEVLRGEQLTPACDVFAWGCVVTYAGTGRSPFEGGNVSEVLYRVAHDPPRLDGLDDDLRGLVEWALDKRPERRPSAGELLTRLVGGDDVRRATALLTPGGEVPAGETPPTRVTAFPASGAGTPPTRVTPAAPGGRGRRRVLILGGAAVLVAALAVAATLIFLRPGTPADTLTAGHLLKPNHSIESPNGDFRLTQQDAGNLVVRDTDGTEWNSHTTGHPGARPVLGDDGRLVIRDKAGTVIWTAVPNV